MSKDKLDYRKYAAFINREKELNYLKEYINVHP